MEKMTRKEIQEFVDGCWLGHLGLASEGRAYVIPIFYGHRNGVLYFHSLPGTKDHFAAGTQEACLTITAAENEDDWRSVQVLGPIADVTTSDETLAAMDALIRVPLPPTEGSSKYGEPNRGGGELKFRKLVPRSISGHKSDHPSVMEADAQA